MLPDSLPPTPTTACSCASGSGSTSASADETINPLALAVLQIPGRGRGVFATRAIRAGTVLEEAPVLVITQDEWDSGKMNDTILGEYGFCWSNGGMGIGLGIASLFNHSSSPNVNFIRNTTTNTITFRTSRAVEPNDELCICYSADETKLWFMPTQGLKAAVSDDEGDGSAALAKVALGDSEDEEERAEREEREAKARARAERAALRAKEAEKDAEVEEKETSEKADDESSDDKASETQDETRREKGGNTHSARDRRREKYRLKMEAAAAAAASAPAAAAPAASTPAVKAAPTPTPTPTPEASASASAPGTPAPEAGVLASAPVPRHRRPVVNAALPPVAHPHESSRHKHVGPVVLTDELPWSAADYDPKAPAPESDWSLLARAKGPVEIEEAEEADNSITMPVWAVEVADARLTRPVLDFLKDGGLENDPRMRHLKRVRRANDRTYIALAVADDPDDTTAGPALAAKLDAFNPALAALEPFVARVPKYGAKTQEQLKARALLWPVVLTPAAPRTLDARGFSAGKIAWVRSGIERILADAAAAKAKGELPIAVYCSSPPEALWPAEANAAAFIPPTPGLRAAGHDTRISEAHPLRHAPLNCIAHVARLRTVPPFSDIVSQVNGADYLLTSMSLFVTHEPCVMCCMALVHSRVREVFFVYPRKRSGGMEGSFGVHSTKVLNHRFDAWQWCGEVPADKVDESVEI